MKPQKISQLMNSVRHQLPPPDSEEVLLSRCKALVGVTFATLASRLSIQIPNLTHQRKGLIGLMLELALGASAGNKSIPDFEKLGIELKTIPIGLNHTPLESTFVTSINLLNIHRETWKLSSCYQKLKRVLWVPIEGDDAIPFAARRIGPALLWDMDVESEHILKKDWELLSTQLGCGQLSFVDAKLGQYLQVRPKAANARALCYGFDEAGQKIMTLPRGFYLRAQFTKKLLQEYQTWE